MDVEPVEKSREFIPLHPLEHGVLGGAQTVRKRRQTNGELDCRCFGF